MTTPGTPLQDIPRYFPGEQQAIADVLAHGAVYGYGNLISHLKQAWSEKLQRSGLKRAAADRGARFICAWCDVDERTGKLASKRKRRIAT